MKFFSRYFAHLFIFGILTFSLLSSCGQNVMHQGTDAQTATQGCQVVQHAMGETCVPQNPERLIVLNPFTLGNAIALGLQPVGSVYDYHDQFPEYLEGKMEGTEPIGIWVQPSIEKITLLKPDLMIGFQHNNESIYSQLSEIAPTVLYDWKGNIHLRNYWKNYFNLIAEVLGREDAAQEVWQHYNQRIEQLKIALGDHYKDKKISVIFFCCGGMYNGRENSFIGSILSDAGLQRPQSQGINSLDNPLSEEKLDVADGDVMFVMARGGIDTSEHNLNRIQQSPLWNKLKAVQNNRVYYVDDIAWSGHNPLAADAVIDDLFKYLVEKSAAPE